MDRVQQLRKVSLRHLRSFLAVAEAGSFTLAASRLFQTQSSLTATIQSFEEAVGLKLFVRTTRRVGLTPEGEEFRAVAERIVRDFDNAIADLRANASGQRGHVRIAAAPSMVVHLLTPALAEFRKAYPEISVSVQDAGLRRSSAPCSTATRTSASPRRSSATPSSTTRRS